MPKPISADWGALKALYLKGMTLPDIARQTGVSYVALRTRAWRKNWKSLAAKAEEGLQQVATLTLAERGKSWAGRVADLMEKRLSHLEKLDASKLKISDLEALTRLTDLTDKTARRTFGLDSEESSGPTTMVQIACSGDAHLVSGTTSSLNSKGESPIDHLNSLAGELDQLQPGILKAN